MIIDEKEYKLLKEIEKLTTTDYNITESTLPQYHVSNWSLLNIIFDLKQEYDHLLEEYTEYKEEQNERLRERRIFK